MNDDIGGGTSPAPRTWLERLGLALLGGEAKNREDLVEELRLARSNGVLDADTLRMLEGALGVVEQVVSDVMVPRGQMVSLSIDLSFDAILQIAIESGHSRFPVFGADEEKVIGCLLAKDLLKCVATQPTPCDIRALLRPARLVPESKRLNELLKDFRNSRAHMAVVVNEYGGIAGLVTIEDVLEEIVGPIDDEHDAEDKPMQYFDSCADGSFSVQALTPIEQFNLRFGTDLSDEESDTIAGFVVHSLGHLPAIGDGIEIDGYRIEVTHADDRRVHTLRLRSIA
jgi:magnesium and cobalt transporter